MGAGAGAGLSAGASLVDDGVEARGHEDRVGAELGAEHGPRARPTKGDSFHTTSPAASGHGGSPVDAPAVRVSSSDHETPSKVPSSPPEVTPRPSEPLTNECTPAHERTSSPRIGAAPPTAPRRRRATLRPRWRQHRPLDARNASTHTPQPFDPSTRPAHPGCLARHGRFHAHQPIPRNQPMPTVNVYGTATIASSGRAPPWGLGHDPPTALSGLGGATATREAQEG